MRLLFFVCFIITHTSLHYTVNRTLFHSCRSYGVLTAEMLDINKAHLDYSVNTAATQLYRTCFSDKLGIWQHVSWAPIDKNKSKYKKEEVVK